MRDTSLSDWLAEGDDDDDLPPDLFGDVPADGHAGPEGREPRAGARAGTHGRGAPRRRLWLVAGGAWALVVVLAVSVAQTPGELAEGEQVSALPPVVPAAVAESHGPPQAGATGAGPGTGPAGAGSPAPDGMPPVPVPPAAGAGQAATAPTDAMVGAAAALAVRLMHTWHDEEAGTSRYVDLALPAGITWYGEFAVVTVDAVVLDGQSAGWSAPRPARYAQPMVLGESGAVPAGDAWALPAVESEPAAPSAEAADAPEVHDTAEAALVAAGYAGVEVSHVTRLGGGPDLLAVTFVGLAPGEPAAALHHAWVLDQDTPRLLGSTESSRTEPQREGEP